MASENRPTKVAAIETDATITPEMVSAGVAAFYVEIDLSEPLAFASQVVAGVYSAMVAARPPSCSCPE